MESGKNEQPLKIKPDRTEARKQDSTLNQPLKNEDPPDQSFAERERRVNEEQFPDPLKLSRELSTDPKSETSKEVDPERIAKEVKDWLKVTRQRKSDSSEDPDLTKQA